MIFYNILPQAKFKIYWVGAARPTRLRISLSLPIEEFASLVFGKSIVYLKIDIEPVFNCYHQQHRELNLIWLCQVLKAISEKFCRKYSPKIFSHTNKINAHKALKKFKHRWFFFAWRTETGYLYLVCSQKQSNEPSKKVLRAENKQGFVQLCTRKSLSPKTLGIRA